jgi:hypothetical protein
VAGIRGETQAETVAWESTIMSINDSELEKVLKAARLPERSEEYWEEFPRTVTTQLKVLGKHERRPRRAIRFVWQLGSAFAAIALVVSVFGWFGRDQKEDPFALLQNGIALREVLTMFPNRVRAIMQDEHGMHLVLSETPDVPVSPPLWVKFCDGRNCRAFVTFSGQELQLAGERVQVLADARGGVMLVGERLLWSSAEPSRIAQHFRIQAHSMGHVL